MCGKQTLMRLMWAGHHGVLCQPFENCVTRERDAYKNKGCLQEYTRSDIMRRLVVFVMSLHSCSAPLLHT